MTPRQSIAAECARRGHDAVVTGCLELLHGHADTGTATSTDAALYRSLAGPAAEPVLQGKAGGLDGYWPRVWGARGLLYAWDDRAAAAIIHATNDEAWRVREMALRVIARHLVGDAIECVVERRTDPNARVRRAAHRAAERLLAARA